MANLWDKVKELFTGPNIPSSNDPFNALIIKVAPLVVDRAQKNKRFTAAEVAEDLTASYPNRSLDDLRDACRAVEHLCTPDFLQRIGYTSSFTNKVEVYHPLDQPATQPNPPAASSTPVSMPTPQPVTTPAGATIKMTAGGRPMVVGPPVTRTNVPPASRGSVRGGSNFASGRNVSPNSAASGPNPYRNDAILGLSADEMRKRALRINPYQTAWIGRVDTIPPQSDERTALIDRGLILRGLLTEQQITDIHRVGDLWIKHHDAASYARVAAAKSADAAIEALRREKLERKAKKKKEAADRKAKHIADVAHRKATDIIFLGAGVSGLLQDRRSNPEKLKERGLPILSTPADVAQAMGIPVPRLRWLCYHNDAVEKTHYAYFEIPKRSGGKRQLAAPMPKLAAAQQWVLENVLNKLPTESEAHGFIKGRSTLSNALPHLKRDLVINLDLSNFFPTITFPRVRGFFTKLGYSPAVATIFALLCTESPRRQVEYEGRRYWVSVGPRALPQGACTSPAISNQVSRKLDRRLRGMCHKRGWVYTRYADDLTFSAPTGKREEIAFLQATVRHVVQEEGFALNPKKGRVQRSAGRQTVTGIVVNQKPGLPRDEVRRLRAILHQAKKTGLEAQNRNHVPHFEAWLRGKLAYLHMVDPKKAEPLQKQLDALKK
jgi:retron-type reverse transcriptase